MDARPTPTPTPRESLLRARADTRRAKRPPLHTRRLQKSAKCSGTPPPVARWKKKVERGSPLPCARPSNPTVGFVPFPTKLRAPEPRLTSHDRRTLPPEPRALAAWQDRRIVVSLARAGNGTRNKTEKRFLACSVPLLASRSRFPSSLLTSARTQTHWQSDPSPNLL